MPWISCPCERLYCNNEREREKKRERPGVREEKKDSERKDCSFLKNSTSFRAPPPPTEDCFMEAAVDREERGEFVNLD